MISAKIGSLYQKQKDNKGLTQSEAEKKLKQYGTNELVSRGKVSPITLFFGQFRDFITIVLLAATLISLFLGEVSDAITIMIIISMNGLLGFIQEYRTEKSLEALKELSAPQAIVIRDGIEKIIPSKEVVPGDLLVLEAGGRVAADSVIVECVNMQVNESILTGESVPVEKYADVSSSKDFEDVPKENRLFMGTTLTSGRGKAIVTQTGMETEMGKIAHMLQNVNEEETPLKKRLNKIGKELVLICLGVCVLIVLAGIYHGETLYNMFFAGVSLAVAAIPEGLPAIVTVSLAIGVQRMLKRNVIIRKLPAVETLGSTNIICSDKTGTLTENKMTVKQIHINDVFIDVTGNGYNTQGEFRRSGCSIDVSAIETLKMLLTIGALCNNAQFREQEAFGDPTEVAIMAVSKKGGIDSEAVSGYKRIAELPFDSERKRMSVICRNKNNELYLYVKGAPDKILGLCTQKLDENGISLFTSTQKKNVFDANEAMASNALRVIAFAYKKLDAMPQNLNSDEIERNLIYVGLEGMIDPPRPEAIEAIKSCYKAAIKPIMITGDHKSTAVAVAKELGLRTEDDNIVVGDELEDMSDEDLENRVEDISIFARVTPKHKLRIVQAFKRRNNIVAMTGDGVNDAPALKEADIGVAMGKSGTDVAKEASSMVLLDDNFASIVAAIEEGRMIYDNIRKFIRYLLSCNLGEILMMGFAALMGMPMPLIPIQILWLNLVTDGLPALALGVDPPDSGIMDRPPRKSSESIFSRGLGSQILVSGLLIGASSLLAFVVTMHLSQGNIFKARTIAFATMIIAELIYAFECRSEHKNIFKVGFTKNKYLIFATLSSFILMFIVMYNPFLSAIFKTDILSINDWLIILPFSVIEFIINSLIPYKDKEV